ncbi:monosaccharide-transporting ATPase [Phaeobacter inhibens]|nr:monosaccharide-transporting ATPase [Phaeobacter inhibens]
MFFVTVQVICVIAALIWPTEFRYLSEPNIRVLLKSLAPLGIMALGVGILMVCGEFDLSVGAVYTFCAIVAATLVGQIPGAETGVSMNAFVALIIAVALGVLIGLLNGVISILFAIPSFIVTLGAMLVWKGTTLFYHGATSLAFRPDPVFKTIFGSTFWVIDMSFVWFIILGIGCHFMLQHHRLGNHMFAVGGNENAATAIGVNPFKVKMIGFAFAGGFAAFAGIVAMTRVGSVQPGGGLGLELQAIAACVIGGAALTGGRGSIIGVMLGAALVFTIQDVLLLIRAPGFYFDIFVGGLIIISVIVNRLLRLKD